LPAICYLVNKRFASSEMQSSPQCQSTVIPIKGTQVLKASLAFCLASITFKTYGPITDFRVSHRATTIKSPTHRPLKEPVQNPLKKTCAPQSNKMGPKRLKFDAPAAKKSKTTVKKKTPYVQAIGRTPAHLGFPRLLKIKHRYVHRMDLTTTGGIATYPFRCNGMFDPYANAGGHQPMYFDNAAAIYDHFTVLSSTIKIEAVGALGTEVPTVIGCYINDDSSVATSDIQALAEQSSCRYKILGGTSSLPVTVYHSWDAKRAFGGDPLSMSQLQGTGTSDPTEQQTYTMYFGPLDTASISRIDAMVTVEYVAVWRELKDQTIN